MDNMVDNSNDNDNEDIRMNNNNNKLKMERLEMLHQLEVVRQVTPDQP